MILCLNNQLGIIRASLMTTEPFYTESSMDLNSIYYYKCIVRIWIYKEECPGLFYFAKKDCSLQFHSCLPKRVLHLRIGYLELDKQSLPAKKDFENYGALFPDADNRPSPHIQCLYRQPCSAKKKN